MSISFDPPFCGRSVTTCGQIDSLGSDSYAGCMAGVFLPLYRIVKFLAYSTSYFGPVLHTYVSLFDPDSQMLTDARTFHSLTSMLVIITDNDA